jgi:hypothetical protein
MTRSVYADYEWFRLQNSASWKCKRIAPNFSFDIALIMYLKYNRNKVYFVLTRRFCHYVRKPIPPQCQRFQFDNFACFIDQGRNCRWWFCYSFIDGLCRSIFQVFIPFSVKNSSAHIYVVEHGNKILTAMSGMTGCSSVTNKKHVSGDSSRHFNLLVLSAFKFVSFTCTFKEMRNLARISYGWWTQLKCSTLFSQQRDKIFYSQSKNFSTLSS